jgi:two-component system, chemotaxis family, sensor kinase CheA
VNTDEHCAQLIAASGSVALYIGADNEVSRVCNAAQLIAWLKVEDFQTGPGTALGPVLDQLLDHVQSQRVQQLVAGLRAAVEPAAMAGISMPARTERLALRQRWFEVSLHPGTETILLLSDISERHELNLALDEARATRDLALTVLRSDATAMRALREAAAMSVAGIRATLRMPARSQEALQEKLARMQHESDALGGQAQVLSLTALVLACEALTAALVALRQKESLSGDELLPLAPRIDAITVALTELERMDQQRAAPSMVVAPRAVASRLSVSGSAVPWHEASESGWRTYVLQAGDTLGVLARLKMVGAELVPPLLQRHVDAILQPLLDNALQHGIEDLERRLKAHKPAAGQITVTFRDLGAEGIEMTVHDDGAGFDVDRIGHAAVTSGLLTEATLDKRNELKVIGLIFQPTFTTAGLPGHEGRGKGMGIVRKTITRLGGKIAVATKRGRYTLFTIRLPALAAASARDPYRKASAS